MLTSNLIDIFKYTLKFDKPFHKAYYVKLVIYFCCMKIILVH